MSILIEKRILGFGHRSDAQSLALRKRLDKAAEKYDHKQNLLANAKEQGGIKGAVKGLGHKVTSGWHESRAKNISRKIKDDNASRNSRKRIDEIKNKYKKLEDIQPKHIKKPLKNLADTNAPIPSAKAANEEDK